MEALTVETRIRCNSKTAYCRRVNETVEWLCRGAPRITRALSSEWILSVGQRPTVVESIQNSMKQSPMEHLCREVDGKMLCPIKVFTGLNLSACSTMIAQVVP